ncbi:MAG: transposase, partial [Nanoarchaeota archaeon]|nr:transposase [Nanoarchaeota archaeon]
ISNNVAERAIRPLGLGRKNWLLRSEESNTVTNEVAMIFAFKLAASRIDFI